MGLFSKAKNAVKKVTHEVGKIITPKNVVAAAAAPFTAGASLALLEDTSGNTVLDHVTGAASARKQNQQNLQIQRELNQQQIDLQRETNQLQIDLANTAHQRQVEDLTQAGINPILTAGGSGAVTPTLGTAQLGATQMQNEMPGGLLAQAQNAVNIMGGIAQAKNLMSNSALAQAQAQNTITDTQYMPAMKKAEIASQYANAGNARAQADYTNLMKDIDAEIKKAETQESISRKELNEANKYRTKNISKGEQSRLWTQAITGGLMNVAGMGMGTMGILNSARNMSMIPGYTANRGIGF